MAYGFAPAAQAACTDMDVDIEPLKFPVLVLALCMCDPVEGPLALATGGTYGYAVAWGMGEPGVSGRAYACGPPYVSPGTDAYEYCCCPARVAGPPPTAAVPMKGLADVRRMFAASRRRRRRHQKTKAAMSTRIARQPRVPPTMAPTGELLVVVTVPVEAAEVAELPEEEDVWVPEEGVEVFVT